MPKGEFVITDWAGNICFNGKKFSRFDEAWEFIYQKFPDEENFEDYEVRIYEEIKKRFL